MNTEPNQPAAEPHKCFSPEGMQAPTTAGMFRPLWAECASIQYCSVCNTSLQPRACWDKGHFDQPVYVDAAALVADQLDAMRESMIAKRTEDKISAAADFKPAPDSWIVFKYNAAPDVPEFQGIFTSEQAACGACHTSLHCVCPATMNVELDQERRMWEGAYYPKRPQPSQNEVVGLMQTAMRHNDTSERATIIAMGGNPEGVVIEDAPMSMRLSDFEKESDQARAQYGNPEQGRRILDLVKENAKLKKKLEGLDAALAVQELKFAQILVEKREQIEALQFSVAEAERTEHKHCLNMRELLKELDMKKYHYDRLLDRQRSSFLENIRLSGRVRVLKETMRGVVDIVKPSSFLTHSLRVKVTADMREALVEDENANEKS